MSNKPREIKLYKNEIEYIKRAVMLSKAINIEKGLPTRILKKIETKK